MIGKSVAGAKLVSALLAAVLLVTCFTTACQPTPDKPAIVNKNDGKLEQTLQAAPQPPAAYKALKHWSETVQNDKLKIVIDTDVFTPDVTAYPVQKLQRAVFSQQRVDELVKFFAQGKQLHLPHVMTKADYDDWIVAAKRGELIDGKYVVTEFTLDWIKELEAKKASAPEDSPIINTDTTLTYNRDYETGKQITENGKNYLQVAFDNGSGGDASISIGNFSPGINNNTIFTYSSGSPVTSGITETMYESILESGSTEEDYGCVGAGVLFDNFDKVEITPGEAAERMDEILSGLGIDHLKLAHTQKYVTPEAPEACGYELVYARQNGGIPLYSLNGGSWNGDEQPPQYSPPFTEEMLTAYVSSEGLSFDWIGCADVVETMNENVPLLPFETIQQRLKDQIFYKESFMQEDALTVTVESAELRMGYIGVKDDNDKALMVPIWVFESRTSINNEGKPLVLKHNIYVLNAIDGGVIEYPREPEEYIDA